MKPTRICIIEGCERVQGRARGWCNGHYLRWNRYGDPLLTKPRPSAEERFWAKVNKTPTCWLWTATTTRGYGSFKVGSESLAHRVSYLWAYGSLPPELDHICRTPRCVRPDHLQPVTSSENKQNYRGARSDSVTGIRGVSWCPPSRNWVVGAKLLGVHYTAGHFSSIEEAELAAIKLRNSLYTNNLVDRARKDAA